MVQIWTSSLSRMVVAVAMYAMLIALAAGKPKTSSKQHEVVELMSHDESCYTQGLVFHQQYLYESCGNYGESSVRRVDPDTGDVLQVVEIPGQYFAEGLAAVGDRLYLLTWNEKIMFEIDINTLTIQRTLTFETYSGEGWGLAYDERQQRLVVSDGSSRLTFFALPTDDAGVLRRTGEVVVRTGVTDRSIGVELVHLNELEMSPCGRYVYANLWYKDELVKIDLVTGQVVDTLYLARLYPMKDRTRTADCLNGIAYNRSDDTLLLTGKLWPSYYRIKVHKSSWNALAGLTTATRQEL